MNTTTLPELGQRKLAAIVFTDMVSFSAMVGRNEEATLQRLQHHFTRMKEFADQWRGQVIKSTGDGLMIYFESATDAVSWSLDVQNRIDEGNKTIKSSERIQHRIGIHLGDVFFKDGDVMGDGVNIAARLQAEADPGGICISQTVYDVVKMRMNVQATFLGGRELKNIRETVPIYQILLNAHQQVAHIAEEPPLPEPSLSFFEQYKTPIVVAGVILFVILDILLFMLWRGKKTDQNLIAKGENTPVILPEASPQPPPTNSPQKPSSFKDMEASYLMQKLEPYKSANPLHIGSENPMAQSGNNRPLPEFDVWKEGDKIAVRRPDGQTDSMTLEAMPRPMMTRIILQLIKNNPNDSVSIQLREMLKNRMEQRPPQQQMPMMQENEMRQPPPQDFQQQQNRNDRNGRPSQRPKMRRDSNSQNPQFPPPPPQQEPPQHR